MAIPKVFVSSTCYDLQEERAQLERFISGYGFQPVLSEYSGVFYSPDEHTHEACVREVSHCDLFVLIISGRFGGKLKNGNGESITQAEYNEARRLNIPIFAFVKADVLAAQFYYKENLRSHDEKFAKKINYPAIEKQDDAVNVFSFIEQVQRSQTNNAIEQYQSFTDIENHLKKQWAGLFYDFLEKRKEQSRVENMSTAINKLLGTTSTLESLVESLHNKNVGELQTQSVIKQAEIKRSTETLFNEIFTYLTRLLFVDSESGIYDEIKEFANNISEDDISSFCKLPKPDNVKEYLNSSNLFRINDYDDSDIQYIGFNTTSGWGIGNSELDLLNKHYHSGVRIADEELIYDAFTCELSNFVIKPDISTERPET